MNELMGGSVNLTQRHGGTGKQIWILGLILRMAQSGDVDLNHLRHGLHHAIGFDGVVSGGIRSI